jgi:hypothetical protein
MAVWADSKICPNGCFGGRCLEADKPVITLISTETSVVPGPGANDDMGVFKIKFNIKSDGYAIIYVPSLVSAATTVTGYNGKSLISVDRAGVATKGGVSVVLTNLSDRILTKAGNYVVWGGEGESSNFELTITAQLPAVGNAGLYRALLKGLAWSLADTYPVTNLYTSNLEAFKTAYQGLN